MAKNTVNTTKTTVAERVREGYDAAARTTTTTTTPFSLAGGVKGVLKGQADSFNSEDVAALALEQEDAVKTMRVATEDESDIVANGGKVSLRTTFGGEAGAKLEALARLIELAGGKLDKPVKPVNRASKPAGLPAPGTATNGTAPTAP